MSADNTLCVNNVSFTVKGKSILKDISLKVCSGDIIGILGPNGAGKTSLFQIIAGLIHPNIGTIKHNNHDITLQPIYHRAQNGITYLPQDSSIFKGLSVEQNILAALESNPTLTPQAHSHGLETLLKDFKLTHLRHNPSTTLSGGERRRVEIARCLALNPEFILLDEPFSGLDPIAIQATLTQIRMLCKRKIGLLITDHNVSETLKICTQIYILNQGEILTQGSAQHVMQHPDVRQLYLGNHSN